MAKNVVIVDDWSAMRELVLRRLRQAGIDAVVESARPGAAGRATAASGSSDLIVCDVKMTKSNGRDRVAKVGNPGD